MRKKFIVFLVVGLISTPIIVVSFARREAITAFFYSMRTSKSTNIAITNKTKTLQPTIVDTAFLDYEFSRLGVFKNNAISDPLSHMGSKDITTRYTVRNVEIQLVPTLKRYLVANGGVTDFAARGIYKIQDDTLVIELSLNTQEIPTTPNATEDVLLRTLLETVLYAISAPNATLDMQGLFAIQQNLQRYISKGLFDRPIRVTEKI